MKRFYYTLIQLFVFLISFSIQAQLVSTNVALTNAVSAATAGTTIILKNGTWTDVQISINKTGNAAGNFLNPITIKAETPGSVFLEGNSYIKMGGSYIFIEGLVFRNPSNLSVGNNVITFKASADCVNCKLTNVKIDSYNGTEAQSTSTFKWVLLYGSYNEISYCSFLGKYGVGSIINDNRNTDAPNYNKIHHNYFADRTFVGTYVDQYNDQDAIRIGNSATSLGASYTDVYENFFNNFQGEIEVISNKSCYNKYYNNTFRNYSGSLTLRHGNNCEVFGNYFLANNQLFSGGIRVCGENHKIYNNYIENVNGAKSSAAGGGTSSNLGGINLIGGIATSVDGANLSGYYQVKNIIITNNTFVNCDSGLRIGGGSYTLPPLDMVAANNIFLMSTSSKKAIDPIVAANSSSPYTFIGNYRQSGTWTLTGNATSNQIVTSGLLTTGTDFYRLASVAASTAGIGSYSFLTNDILGASRPETGFAVGAEEINSGGTKVPYTTADVGVKVGFYGDSNLSVSKNVLGNNNLILYPIPASGDFLNVNYNANLGLVKIVDMQGKVVIEKLIDDSTAKIDVSNLPKGVFILKTQTGVSKVFIR